MTTHALDATTQAQADEALADLRRMAREQEAHNRDALHRLRVLRLWHWRALLAARMHARSCASASLMRQYNDAADTHLKFVQSLNDFFENGDTAERDCQREDVS